ncbi:MAG: choice-of-anchor Q domain-containing protein, partial [Candidatus Bipolaricaulota bacterium]|nr:choice-of-anchor Q domain-containing protein [Candidatus Bipolaricaulota bacterium]
TLAIQNSIIRECSSQDPGAGGGGLANRGQAALTGVTVENNTAVGFGGGIFNLGQLQVFTSLIRNNTTGAGGGGICNISQVYLEDVFVEDNQAGGVGGGIASILILANPATLDMIRGAIRRNQAIEIGGGLVNGSGWPGLQATARLVDVTVQGNVAIHQNNFAVGGGIANIATSGGLAELELLRVTISANQLDSAPQVSSVQLLGAGMANTVLDGPATARARLTNVTISRNEAAVGGGKIGVARGGGIYNANEGAQMIITHTTIYDNFANEGGSLYDEGAVTNIRSSIVAVPFGFRRNPENCRGTLESLGHNLFNPLEPVCTGLHPTDLIGLDPLLGPLQNNGGLTETHELLPGSPARDYVPLGACLDFNNNALTEDQRTDPRPKGPGCDIGAFEARPLATITVQKRAQDLNGTPLLTDDIILYTIVIANAGPGDQDNHVGPEFVDPIPLGTVYVSGSATATSGTISFNSGSNQIEWDGDIPAGTSVTITFQVQVTARSRGSGFVDLNNKPSEGLFWWLQGLFGFGCLLSSGWWLRRRPRLALVILLLLMPAFMSACTLAPCAPVQICNQGTFYTDDPLSREGQVIPSDDPDTPRPNDPTCLR